MENLIGVAVKAIILFERKALIIQRSSDVESNPDIWEFVGGKLEFGESLEDCLRREIREEVNLDVEVKELLYATTFMVDEMKQTVILAYVCNASIEHVTLSSEHKSYMWANKDQMKALLWNPILQDHELYSVWDRLCID